MWQSKSLEKTVADEFFGLDMICSYCQTFAISAIRVLRVATSPSRLEKRDPNCNLQLL